MVCSFAIASACGSGPPLIVAITYQAMRARQQLASAVCASLSPPPRLVVFCEHAVGSAHLSSLSLQTKEAPHTQASSSKSLFFGDLWNYQVPQILFHIHTEGKEEIKC